MGEKVLQAGQKSLDLVPFNIFRGGGFYFYVDQPSFEETDHVVVSPVAAPFAAQTIERRAGKFPLQHLGHEPLQGGPQAGRGEGAQLVKRISQGLGQTQVHQRMKILSARFRGRKTDHLGDPEFSLPDQDFPKKEAERIFFK